MVIRTRTKKTMTPAEKARAFKAKLFRAKKTAMQFAFCSVYGVTAVQPFTHAGQKIGLRLPEVEAVCDTPLLWKIGCYAICKDTAGRDYIKSMCIVLSEPVKQSAINKALSQAHYDWMKQEVNMRHLLTLAWIATTGPEPSDETAAKMFAQMGAWSDFDYVQALPDGDYLTVEKRKL